MQKADILICGAGISGLTIARELLARGAENIVIIDKEDAPGRHASGRNSGVLHAGIYYAPGSLKARTCMEGARRMRAYCREKGLPLLEAGKVIVARDESELPALDALFERAKTGGAVARMIDEKELAEIEPYAVTAGRAIFSPKTSMIDPRIVLASLRQDIEETGRARFVFNAPFNGLKNASTAMTGQGEIGFSLCINAAGAHADTVAAAFGAGKGKAAIPFKGIYRKLRPEKAHMVRGNIYPVPDARNPFLGVHFTRGVSGDVYIGPTAIPALGRENYGILSGIDAEAPAILWRDMLLFLRNPKFRDVALTEPKKYFFKYLFADAKKLIRDLAPEDVLPSPKCGIRPQLVNLATGELIMDFCIESSERAVHILNAISPAFTASMAFAEMAVVEHIAPTGLAGIERKD